MLMKPCCNSVIGSPKRIFNGKSRHGIRERKQGVYHKRAEEAYGQQMASQSTNLDSQSYAKGVARSPGGDCPEATPPEIVLAKRVCVRYIACTLFIRYVDVRIALTL